MPVDVKERWGSRKPSTGDNPSNEIEYLLFGSDDDSELILALGREAPTTLNGLYQRSLAIREQIGDRVWAGVARYGSGDRPENKQTGDSEFAFDTTGGTEKILVSRRTVARYPFVANNAAASAPDLRGAINVSGDEVEGVEIVLPKYGFSETHYLPDQTVTDAYKGLVFRLTGCVNSKPYKGGAAGEILFLGAVGSKRGRGDWQITYKFAGSPNVKDLTYNLLSGAVQIAKKGWEFVHFGFAMSPVGAGQNKRLRLQPDHLYVEQIYLEDDLGLLGIGT
jgi:hypothetical protein